MGYQTFAKEASPLLRGRFAALRASLSRQRRLIRHSASSERTSYPSLPPRGRKLSRSVAPPLPTGPASLGSGGNPVGVFSAAHVAGKNDLDSFAPAGAKLCEAFKGGCGSNFFSRKQGSQGSCPVGAIRLELFPPLAAEFFYLSSRQATPGSSFPSRNSREAPPPVEMWVILSA